MAGYSRRALQGRWVHSHEEDSDDEMVFRPASHAFPPARGRTAFELRPDGSYLETAPGPDDRPERSTGAWSVRDGRLVIEREGDLPGDAWEVAGVEEDRLTLRK